MFESFLEKSQENGPLAEKWQDRKSKSTRQNKTREEIGKGNQMIALRFQTGEWHQTSPASLWGWQAEVAGFCSRYLTHAVSHWITCLFPHLTKSIITLLVVIVVTFSHNKLESPTIIVNQFSLCKPQHNISKYTNASSEIACILQSQNDVFVQLQSFTNSFFKNNF